LILAHHSRVLFVGGLLAALIFVGCSSPEVGVGDPCETTSDCAPERALVCENGFCFERQCTSTTDCPQGTSCIDDACRAPECSSDDECSERALCLSSECVEGGCRSKSACEPGQVCRGEPNTCQAPPAVCAVNEDCPVGTTCWPPSGECRNNCDEISDCDSGQYCGEQGQCRPNCTRDADCLSDEVCTAGRCESLPDCSEQTPCSGRQRYRDPLTCECVACLRDEQCDASTGEVCTDNYECLFCQLSAAGTDCEARGLFEDQGCCVECLIDADCGSDAPFCSSGRCSTIPPDECISDADCADGQVCDRNACKPAASFSDCDVQADCPDGEACFLDGRCHAEADTCGGCEGESRCVEGATGSNCAGCQSQCSSADCRDGRVCVISTDASDGICIDEALATQCSG
jgi:hypothetical protein